MAQSQCVANIENNPLNYERDWQLDDSSQSSFKPCPQGSGSMTPLPFHDSAHTMYEANSQFRSVHSSMDGSGFSGFDLNQIPNSAHVLPLVGASSNTIASTSNDGSNKHEYGLLKVHSSGPHRNSQHQYPTTSVFLENSDILDDKDYPKLYRHSTIMMPDEINCNSDAKTRRYSDTKLLHAANNDDNDDDDEEHNVYMRENYNQPLPIFNVATVLGASIPTTSNEAHTENYQITDIIFDGQITGGTYDPLELNIQEMLELDMANSRRYSMNNVADGVDEKCNIHYTDVGSNVNNTAHVNNSDNRNIFKSMPNLSASSENLLQK